MTRLGLTPDELLATTWASGRTVAYAAHLPAVAVLEGETLALVGSGAPALLEELAAVLPEPLEIDGAVAAAGGALRIHAQQAARVGVRSLVISDPFPGLGSAARSLVVADLAGLGNLGVTTVFAAADPHLAALAADRVALVEGDGSARAYPVIAPTPRTAADVEPVTARLLARLSR